MAKRIRKQRAFTLPDDFVERLAAMASIRQTTMSQLVQEYGEQGLRSEEYLVEIHKEGKFGRLRIGEVLSNQRLLDIAKAIVFARDADEDRDAHMELHEWLEWNEEYIHAYGEEDK